MQAFGCSSFSSAISTECNEHVNCVSKPSDSGRSACADVVCQELPLQICSDPLAALSGLLAIERRCVSTKPAASWRCDEHAEKGGALRRPVPIARSFTEDFRLDDAGGWCDAHGPRGHSEKDRRYPLVGPRWLRMFTIKYSTLQRQRIALACHAHEDDRFVRCGDDGHLPSPMGASPRTGRLEWQALADALIFKDLVARPGATPLP